ncbi:carboxypeptidase regulatory-like domain-containing protein [Foetidibacter luteolus]|uniref:carboxypeptidase regulatory-like domain-containing protein n=1 Tax=Foetidibacter luteolus TaxID=2608880 RepID=UPI00129B22BE|nr:carboxypeptidase regulatory-like domain-containing protein [Foetidibacter luteolus]
MKRFTRGLMVLAIAVCGLFAFTTFQTGGSIKGTVSPADGAKYVWAVSATDTLKTLIAKGAFQITNAKAGTYKIMVDATVPYKDVIKDGVQVADGQLTDVGEIKLEK